MMTAELVVQPVKWTNIRWWVKSNYLSGTHNGSIRGSLNTNSTDAWIIVWLHSDIFHQTMNPNTHSYVTTSPLVHYVLLLPFLLQMYSQWGLAMMPSGASRPTCNNRRDKWLHFHFTQQVGTYERENKDYCIHMCKNENYICSYWWGDIPAYEVIQLF